MWFNNKFNSDNTIHFDVNEWQCTDPDELQFCRKISDTEFEYIQLKRPDMAEGCPSRKEVLDYLNDKTYITDWWQDEINVEDYDADELGEYVAPYGGDDFLGNADGAFRNQLMAECIFEQDIVFGDCY